jgi:hypothetical protein
VNGPSRADSFVSYTQADRAWAEWIGWQLEQAGYTVIVQAWDFLPGTDWVHQMHTAVQRARHTLTVLSSAYVESGFGKPSGGWRLPKIPAGRAAGSSRCGWLSATWRGC